MNIYYKNLNVNDNGVTGSCHHLQIKINGKEDFNIVVDYGQIQNQKLKPEQLYKLNGRNVPIVKGGDNFEFVDVVCVTHSHS